ncbi:MAG: RluA family pseudouridine synthase [Flavobacterium sp.]|nr:MAG: RluA family pseudouridine synthase [Flavobacterium sp.]
MISDRILYEDNHVIVVNKLPSELTQGDKTGDAILPDLIKSYLKEKYQKPGNVFLGVVHRLDRPTSGALVFARTSKALERLNAQFRDKETNKVYWAIVGQKPTNPNGSLVHYLKKNETQNKSYVVAETTPGAKKATLHYQQIGASERYFLLEVQLETGRHHQIRCQLSNMGCIIKGDLKYGFDRSNPDGGIHLHARKLVFIHPVSKEPLSITAPVPDDVIWKAI